MALIGDGRIPKNNNAPAFNAIVIPATKRTRLIVLIVFLFILLKIYQAYKFLFWNIVLFICPAFDIFKLSFKYMLFLNLK